MATFVNESTQREMMVYPMTRTGIEKFNCSFAHGSCTLDMWMWVSESTITIFPRTICKKADCCQEISLRSLL